MSQEVQIEGRFALAERSDWSPSLFPSSARLEESSSDRDGFTPRTLQERRDCVPLADYSSTGHAIIITLT